MPSAPTARHPWEIARRRFFCELLDDAGIFSEPRRVLDVGAGDGYVSRGILERLPPGSDVVCFDPNYDAELLERFEADAPAGLSFTADPPEGSFDLLLALDVCEHVEDDQEMLRDMVGSYATPEATLLLSVPAHAALYDRHDAALGHYRRYSPREGRALVERAGLKRLADGGVFYSLLVPRALAVSIERARRGRAAHLGDGGEPEPLQWTRGPVLTAAVNLALRVDLAVSRRVSRLPLPSAGLSWWALCTNG